MGSMMPTLAIDAEIWRYLLEAFTAGDTALSGRRAAIGRRRTFGSNAAVTCLLI
jgi:hypothetical protein